MRGVNSQPASQKKRERTGAVPVGRGSGETAGKSEESCCSERTYIYGDIKCVFMCVSLPYLLVILCPMIGFRAAEWRLASLPDPCCSRTSAGPAVSFFLLAKTLYWPLAVLVMDLIRLSLGTRQEGDDGRSSATGP